MINVTVKAPTYAKFLRAASAQIEKQLSSKAKLTGLRHRRVAVRFKHKANGVPASVEIQGSDEAVAAAKSAMQR